MSGDRRVLGEREVSAVVRRALELQEKDGEDSFKLGVTPEELTRVAAELGIQPKYVQQAMSESVTSLPHSKSFRVTEEFIRTVDVELAPDDFDAFLSLLHRPSYPNPPQQFGRTVSGITQFGGSTGTFEVTSKKGQTSVKITSNQAAIVGLLVLLACSISLLAIVIWWGIPGGGMVGLGMCLVSLLILALGRFLIVPAIHRSAERLANKVADNIAATGKESVVQSDRPTSLSGDHSDLNMYPEKVTPQVFDIDSR